jgi:hypothetical protein
MMLHSKMTKTLTRKQLHAYGLSKYQAVTITKCLIPIGKEGRSVTFELSDVIDSLRQRLSSPRLKQRTRDICYSVLKKLLERLGNIVEIPFSPSNNPEIQKAGTQLLRAIAQTNATLADLKAEADEIQFRQKVAQ